MARTKNRYRKETIIEEVSLQTYRTGIYIRLSKERTENWRNKSQSLETQESLARAFAKEKGLVVTKCYIDYEYSPVKVYLYSDVLSYNRDYESTLETYSVNTVRAQLNQKKSAGTTFDVVLPSSVSFKLNITPRVNNPRDVDPAIYSFSDFLKLMFKFGQELCIDNDFFDVFK